MPRGFAPGAWVTFISGQFGGYPAWSMATCFRTPSTIRRKLSPGCQVVLGDRTVATVRWYLGSRPGGKCQMTGTTLVKSAGARRTVRHTGSKTWALAPYGPVTQLSPDILTVNRCLVVSGTGLPRDIHQDST